MTLGIYVEVLQRWFGDIDGLFARGKICIRPSGLQRHHPRRRALGALPFHHGAEGVLEFSGIPAHATGDRLEVYGSAGTLLYDFTADVIKTGGWATAPCRKWKCRRNSPANGRSSMISSTP